MWAAGSWKANAVTMNDTPNPAGREGGGGQAPQCIVSCHFLSDEHHRGAVKFSQK